MDSAEEQVAEGEADDGDGSFGGFIHNYNVNGCSLGYEVTGCRGTVEGIVILASQYGRKSTVAYVSFKGVAIFSHEVLAVGHRHDFFAIA